MGIVLQNMRLGLALRAAPSRILTKPGPAPSDSSTGRTVRGFDSHNNSFHFLFGAAPQKENGAGDGNRTHIIGLGSRRSATELHPDGKTVAEAIAIPKMNICIQIIMLKIVDSYNDDDYYYSDTITQEELDRRLKYADISVRLNYYNPRDGISKFGIKVSNAIEDIWDSFGDIIQVIIIIFIVLFALFGELILFYKLFVKMMYKHRHKYPKYYPPKSVYVVTNDDMAQLKAESKTIEYEKNMDSK